jgi:hypothetical protein
MLVIASCVLLAESETITQFNITRANLITSALASCLLVGGLYLVGLTAA